MPGSHHLILSGVLLGVQRTGMLLQQPQYVSLGQCCTLVKSVNVRRVWLLSLLIELAHAQ